MHLPMKALIVGTVIAVVWILVWKFSRWQLMHQRVIGATILLYGCYLAMLTGTTVQFILPGIGKVAGGALAGAGVGLITASIIGTIGVVTGGVGIAIGIWKMAMIGAGFGAIGGAAGNAGFNVVSYHLVRPYVWIPMIILGIYFIKGSKKKKSPDHQNLPQITP